MSRPLAALAAVLLVGLLVWVTATIRRIRWQIATWKKMIDELYYMAGYTELITRSPIDDLRGIAGVDSKVGLFKEDREIRFYWFVRNGQIRNANVFRLNNLGLISQKRYDLARLPDEYRIVVLGDEMTAATTAEVSWPDWLQDLLCADAALLERLGKTRFSVLNFGWPDAGFAHMARVWREKAKPLDPDLVLVNMARHDFSRYGTGAHLFFRGRANSEWGHECVAYTSPAGLQAWLSVIRAGSGRDLKSADCTSARPFALYLPRELAENPEELAAVQEHIVSDYAGRTDVWNNLSRILRITPDTTLDGLLGRAIETEQAVPAADSDLVAHARTHLRAILDDHPNVRFTYNPLWIQVLDPSATRPWVEALGAVDPALEIIDMRAYLPSNADRTEVESWYQVPHAAEKWSSKGHRVYAGAQARLIAGLLAQRVHSMLLLGATLIGPLLDAATSFGAAVDG